MSGLDRSREDTSILFGNERQPPLGKGTHFVSVIFPLDMWYKFLLEMFKTAIVQANVSYGVWVIGVCQRRLMGDAGNNRGFSCVGVNGI